MGQQSLKLLFTGNSLNDSKKGINTMARKDTYDAGSISVLEGLEAAVSYTHLTLPTTSSV